MLEEFIEKPRSFSLPKMRYNNHLHGLDPYGNLEDKEIFMNHNDMDSKYEFDIEEYEKYKT